MLGVLFLRRNGIDGQRRGSCCKAISCDEPDSLLLSSLIIERNRKEKKRQDEGREGKGIMRVGILSKRRERKRREEKSRGREGDKNFQSTKFNFGTSMNPPLPTLEYLLKTIAHGKQRLEMNLAYPR